jgi:hypothetical protein
MTWRRPSQLIGMSFFDLFVKETNYVPCMTTCPTLEGMFANDIVRVKSFRHCGAHPPVVLDDSQELESSSWRLRALDIFDTLDDSIYDNNDQEDDTGIFCHIDVREFPQQATDPASSLRPTPSYFSIRLAPLRGVSESLHSSRTGGTTACGIVYLPMPAMPRQG